MATRKRRPYLKELRASKKPKFQAQKAVQEILIDLPYDITIDYSPGGQAGTLVGAGYTRVPGHFLDVVFKRALQEAWAQGFLAACQGK